MSLGVIAILIAILLPSLSMVRETARRVVCASNVRQHGLGLAMYVEDYNGQFPHSIYAPTAASPNGESQRMNTVRIYAPDSWDGLGVLFNASYIDAPGVFYCPSHKGVHTLTTYSDKWNSETRGEIVANYHYRGSAPGGRRLTLFGNPALAIVGDAMRTVSDFNHGVGTNVLRLDMSMMWYSDSSSRLAMGLPVSEADPAAASKVGNAWAELDNPAFGEPVQR